MKKPTNDIDLLFHSHFDTHEIPVSKQEDLWGKIQARINNKSRGLILLFVLFLSTSGWLAYAQLAPTDMDQIDNNYTQTKELNNTAGYAEASSKNNSASLKETLTPASLTASSSNNTNNQEIKSSSITSVKSSNSTQVEISKYNARSQKAIANKTKLSKSNSDEQAGGGGSNLHDYLIQHPNQMAATEVPVISNQQNEEVTISASTNQVTSSYQLSDLSSIESLSPSALPLSASYLVPLPSNKTMKKCVVGFSNFNPFIDVYGTFAAPLETVSLGATALDQTQYLTTWKEQFDPLTSLSAGIAVGNEWHNGIGASVGIEYQRMESQYKTTQTITERTTIFDPMAFFFFDANDEIVWVGDSVTSVTTYDRTVAHANTTTLLNIPLLISYNLVENEQWKVKATAGGVLNLSLKYNGRYLQSDQTLLVLDETNQEGIVAPRIGIGVEAGVDFGYFLTPQWELYASPRYRLNKSSYWQNDAAISLSRDYLGIRTGIRYNF